MNDSQTAVLDPIPIKDLQKGQYISAEMIEAISGLSREDDQYRFKQMELVQSIQDRSEEEGTPLFCRCREDGIYILTDEEAAVHQPRKNRNNLRKFVSGTRRLGLIDDSKVSEATLCQLNADRQSQASMVAALKREEKRQKLLDSTLHPVLEDGES